LTEAEDSFDRNKELLFLLEIFFSRTALSVVLTSCLSRSLDSLQVRLAWHDSASYDKNIDAGWPKHGGANGKQSSDAV